MGMYVSCCISSMRCLIPSRVSLDYNALGLQARLLRLPAESSDAILDGSNEIAPLFAFPISSLPPHWHSDPRPACPSTPQSEDQLATSGQVLSTRYPNRWIVSNLEHNVCLWCCRIMEFLGVELLAECKCLQLRIEQLESLHGISVWLIDTNYQPTGIRVRVRLVTLGDP
jgi:hypothetical protein